MSKQLIDQLIALTKDWNAHDLVPEEQKAECKKIGEQLCAEGGLGLMQKAYYDAHAKNKCASVIQAYWDGVGLWSW